MLGEFSGARMVTPLMVTLLRKTVAWQVRFTAETIFRNHHWNK